MTRIVRLWVAMLTMVVVVGSACGDATQDPDDCAEDQYYDEAEGLCFSCPAVVEPTCREGCGFVIVEDARGCPGAECAAGCDLCEEGETFSSETFRCVPADFVGG